MLKRLAFAIALGAPVLAAQFVDRFHQRQEDAASVRIDRELGMTFQQVDRAMAADLNLPPKSSGLVITSTAEGRAADRSGLEAGDLLEQIGSTSITDPLSAARALDANRNRKLDLIVYRYGRDLQVAVNRG